MKIKYLLALALYCSVMLSAASTNSTNSKTADFLEVLAGANIAREFSILVPEQFDANWEDLISESKQKNSGARNYSDNFDLNFLLRKSLPDRREQYSLINDQYLSRLANNDENSISEIQFKDLSNEIHDNSNLAYFYENNRNMGWPNAKNSHENQNQIYIDSFYQQYIKAPENEKLIGHQEPEVNDYQHRRYSNYDKLANYTSIIDQIKRMNYTNQNPNQNHSNIGSNNEQIEELASEFPAIEKENRFRISDSFGNYPLQAGFINTMVENFDVSEGEALNNITVAKNLKAMVQSDQNLEKIPILKDFSFTDKKKNIYQNYAIIVGIDNYTDRMSLHTCVNDAEAIKDLLSSLGYKVFLLSDDAKEKPTKENILDDALAKLSHLKNRGNIIFYFSGHAEIDQKGVFYLIPQDANGNPSSYISKYELAKYIRDIRNLAVIIDACNGEGLGDAIGTNQLLLASSRENEPSNEEWIGSLSVFTLNLCKAIKEERQKSDRILLQKCFHKAYEETVLWSKGHLLSQEPVLKDLTGGKYYLE